MTKPFLLFIVFLFSLSLEAQVTLDIRMFIEGFYSAGNNGRMNNIGQGGCLYLNGLSTNFNDADTIQISIMDQLTYAEVESHKVILQTDGNVSSIFNSLILGNSYFIKINHRNTLET